MLKNQRNFDKWLKSFLVQNDTITDEQLIEYEKEVTQNKPFHELITEKNILSSDELLSLAREVMANKVISLEDYPLSLETVKIIPKDFQEKYTVLPLKVNSNDRTLEVAMYDVSNLNIIDAIKSITKLKPIPIFALSQQIKNTTKTFHKKNDIHNIINEMNGTETEVQEETQKLEDLSAVTTDEPAIIRIVNSILSDAVSVDASDIHIEPTEKSIRVRFRVDGILIEKIKELDKKHHSTIVARIKILSELDITEHRKPQDGRFKIRVGGNFIDIRVSTMPTQYGEKIVMRLTNKSISIASFDQLGFDEREIKILKDCVEKPYGLILATGPTGSGKSTTLYGLLTYLNSPDINIVTVEEPIEREIHGISQTSVENKIGYTFATGLKTILRQDPDVIMVGEIRDNETADMAIQAALTGHLVLSTLHTNDAVGSLTRMIDMGIETFKISSSLLVVIAQRLARKVCPHCSEDYIPTEDEVTLLRTLSPKKNIPDNIILKKGRGCTRCSNTGYKGRIGVYEILKLDSELKKIITRGASEEEIKDKAIELGMQTMQSRGVDKVLNGITTLDEIRKIVFY